MCSQHHFTLVFFHCGKGEPMPVLYEATFFAGARPIDCCQEATLYFSRRLPPQKGILCCRGLVPNPDNGVGLSRYHIQCLRAFLAVLAIPGINARDHRHAVLIHLIAWPGTLEPDGKTLRSYPNARPDRRHGLVRVTFI